MKKMISCIAIIILSLFVLCIRYIRRKKGADYAKSS